MTALEPALGRQVRSVWETAQRGAALTGGFPPGSRPETGASLSEQLRSVQAERSLPENGADDRLAELDRTEEIVAARLREAKRAESVAAWLRDGLRSAITRLEAAVTSLAELAGQESVTSERGDLPGSLDAVEEQLSALQAGMQEVTGALPPGGPPPNRSKP